MRFLGLAKFADLIHTDTPHYCNAHSIVQIVTCLQPALNIYWTHCNTISFSLHFV